MTSVLDIQNLLNYDGKIELIGSNKLNLKYPTDYDFQVRSYINPKSIKEKKRIRDHFKNIFEVVNKTEKCYITDFKSGIYHGAPIRWEYDDIITNDCKKEIVPGDTVLLMNNLDHCKLDIVCWTGELYDEFSCNYYFYEEKPIDIYNSLIFDIHKYKHEHKYMKMLKRIMSYRLKKGLDIDDIVEFFNGKAGELYQQKHRLEVRELIGIDIDKDELERLNNETNELAVKFIG